MRTRNLYDNSNRRIALGEELGRGGEGTVHEVVGSPSDVAKLYHTAPTGQTGDKLKAMARLATPELHQVAAWPKATLHDGRDGPVVGLVMSRVEGYKEVHILYSPAHRKTDFPTADWRFLVRTARNCASAFDVLHRAGHVIGDVNPANVLVSAQATVKLIDCDSYQVHAHGRPFPCEVGVPIYTAPELQGKSFRGLVRTPNHDRFGLAVLIFHLLFMGRHPFSGRFLGKGEMSLERAIAEFRFAFAGRAGALQMTPPPHALPLAATPPDLAGLFERAFGPHSAQPNARPSSAEWMSVLGGLEQRLKECRAVPGHWFSAHLVSCPWCQLMRAGAPNFFVAIAVRQAGAFPVGGAFVLASVWGQIDRVPTPPALYRRPHLPAGLSLVPAPLPPGVPAQLPQKVAIPATVVQNTVGVIALAGGLLVIVAVCFRWPVSFLLLSSLVLGVWWAVLEVLRLKKQKAENAGWQAARELLRREREFRQHRRDAAWDDLRRAEEAWAALASKHAADFASARRKLEGLKCRYEGLQPAYDMEYRQLEQNREAMQRDQFLQQQFISDHKIPGIGPAREAVLRSNGIETAHDVVRERVLQLPGFGGVLTRALLDWRRKVTANFRFDPSAGVPRSEVDKLKAKYAQHRQELEAQLLKGPAYLAVLSAQAGQQLNSLLSRIEQSVVAVAQAETDLSHLPPVGP